MNIDLGRVVGPYGETLTLANLPPPKTVRWTIRRKAEVVAAVDGGLLTFDQARQRYSVSLEEMTSWQRAVRRSGMPGLRVTRAQHYSDFYESDEVAKQRADLGVKRFLAALSG